MKTLRKNVDLSTETVAILQIEATLSEFGSLKPFLEQVLNDFAKKARKGRPGVYEKVFVSKKTFQKRGSQDQQGSSKRTRSNSMTRSDKSTPRG